MAVAIEPVSLLVSIHDVTPAHAPRVVRLWETCASLGVVPALLVVPQWHGAWPLEEHPAFIDWLRGCAVTGADVFLHGERHDEAGSRRSWADHLRATGRTAGEGEFLTLGREEARDRIGRGLARLRALGLDPLGFVPPAWLMTRGGREAVADVGLRLTEDDAAVHVLCAPHRWRRVPSTAVRWSGRTHLRAVLSATLARAHRHRHTRLVRVALHPADLGHATTAASVARELAWWTSRASPERYATLTSDAFGN